MLKKTLILSNQDIVKLIDMRKVLRIVEEAFIAQASGRIQMPAKIYLHLDKYAGDFRAMPAYIEGMDACGIKWVNVHPENKKHGLPAVMAVIVLSDPHTGFPLAIMDGTYITNLRTGASGGIAAKYLANRNSSTVSLVGCGNQAQTQLMALCQIFKIKSVSIYDCDYHKANAFIKKMSFLMVQESIKHFPIYHSRKSLKVMTKPERARNFLEIKIKYCNCIEDCIRGADILVTTTPSRKPIIKSEWICPGVHINAIGADAKGKEELEPAILKRAKVIVDDKIQAMHSGEINVPIAKKIIKETDIHATLGEIISGKKKGRLLKEEITVFDSTGLAICDVAVANSVYKMALKNKFGFWAGILK